MKRIAILGSTGSIGTQALEVIEAHPENGVVELLTAHNNANLLIEQAIKFSPNSVVISNEDHYLKVKDSLAHLPIKVYAGADAIVQCVCSDEIDLVLTAQVGFSGLRPTIAAIQAGKTIALANKETLVVAGDYISSLCLKHNVKIIPVDSEHSAIFQCLVGEYSNPIEKIYLTASGGPFRGKTKSELALVTKAQALKHPNWTMGAKITIDSASLMNKALEIIEAKWLFGLEANQIDVIVHPQSIIHSIVQFNDGSMKAQMGLPDMKLPIHYAFTYPERISTSFPRFDFLKFPQLSFETPDKQTFRSLEMAYYCLQEGGNMACILNAANEVANAAFLNDKIKFLQIFDLVEGTLERATFIAKPTINNYYESDAEAREIANNLIK
ncbi:MAG: 1-deoxy-D-xylulose-5-phosphate reductoisomerase [Bacteroidetes bacterium]|nr:1-deoxy-D-xylulose-5-phosphate reductoisomerase [Bacteroidota bacterium]